MHILTVLTYYRPHTSGLTIYAERLARGLVERNHTVTILTSRFSKQEPREEVRDGVRVVRAPVAFRMGKGVIMPTMGLHLHRLTKQADIVHLHLPQFDSAIAAYIARLNRKPIVVTYHCDLQLPAGLLNRATNSVVHRMNCQAGWQADRVVAYTDDFASHSPYLRKFGKKVTTILPPVEVGSKHDTPKEQGIASVTPVARPRRSKFATDSKPSAPVIGMATRFASEKGVEILLHALPLVHQHFPDAKVHFAGQHQNVWGEEHYRQRLSPVIEKYEQSGHWQFLGNLTSEQMPGFYRNIDLLVVPSVNSTESFGLVQIEAMICGTPVVASDLPGVRQPVTMTGMGEIVPRGDHRKLAEAILRVITQSPDSKVQPDEIVQQFSTQRAAENYERLFEDEITRRSAA